MATLAHTAHAEGSPVQRGAARLSEGVKLEVERHFDLFEGVADIAKSVGVSVPSVYRILRETGRITKRRREEAAGRIVAAKNRWECLQTEYPTLGALELRGLAPATYALLYREDRAWLCHQTSSSRARGRQKRKFPRQRLFEREARAAIDDVGKAICNSPRRLSRGRVALTAGISPFYLETCGGDAAVTLHSVVEDDERFVNRRVHEATKNRPHTPGWQLLRRAGLRVTAVRLRKLRFTT
ncbi:TnsD family Tn7-like transposition protein [Paraburkholderia sp. EG287A]|uniref:TnsD family Tn7-like transposition protein n=1 Tax=Paraburkholderia sp. EG287A TaxID=3237012 RepID=UPI0034D28176